MCQVSSLKILFFLNFVIVGVLECFLPPINQCFKITSYSTLLTKLGFNIQ